MPHASRRPRGLVGEMHRSHRAAVAALAVMLVLSLTSGALLLQAQRTVERYTELSRQARLAHEAMLDQETGLRGWLATGDRVFLEPYDEGRLAVERANDQLVRQSASDPVLVEQVVRLLVARQAWQSWSEDTAAMGHAGTEPAQLTGVLLEGKDLFDRYRAVDQSVTARVVGERDRALARQRSTLVIVMAAYVLALSTAGVLAVRRRGRVERTVVEPVRQVLSTIESIRAGDLRARCTATGVAELDAVGEALGSLAGTLSRAEQDADAREARLVLMAGRFEVVARVAREVSGSLSIRYVSEAVAAAAAGLLGRPTCLWVRTEDGGFHAVRRSADPHGTVPPSDVLAPALVAGAAADARPLTDATGRRAYPLVLAGMVVGVLEVPVAAHPVGEDLVGDQPVDHHPDREVDQDVEQVLLVLLSTAAAALESARLHRSARELADVDALTQLPNRRRLDSDLATEWERAHRYSRPLSFVMVDLDHFKRFNDEHGHLVGDTVLHDAAAAVLQALRSTDTAYRYGGEEIAVMLRETTLEDAAVVAERLRQAIRTVRVPDAAGSADGTPIGVSASLGVAERGAWMQRHEELVARADAALYEAKCAGRDRVVLDHGSLVPVAPLPQQRRPSRADG